MRTSSPVLCVAAILLGAVLLPHASAQAPRNGIRIEYTALDPAGQAGRAFLPLAGRDVRREDHDQVLEAITPCPGALRLEVTARQRRGVIRTVKMWITVREPATLPLEIGACPGAFVQTTLEDRTVLSGGTGEVVVTNTVLAGRVAGFVTGRFTQTATRNGTPVTIRGEFRIPLPPPSAAERRPHVAS